MALAIGGCTIEELKQRMTVQEARSWMAYRGRRGPLNPMLRQDSNFAVLHAQVSRAVGGKAKPADFMPWAKDEDDEGSVGDVMSILTGAVG